MYALSMHRWSDRRLDEHRSPAEVRVAVRAWANLRRLDDLYFVRPRSLRLLWNYTREIGPAATLAKVVSRRRERARNEKYAAVGYGVVVEPGDASGLDAGQPVAFLAPSHPACAERVVLPAGLVAAVDAAEIPGAPGAILLGQAAEAGDRWWEDLAGWSPYSGVELSADRGVEAMRGAVEALGRVDWPRARRLPLAAPSPVAERREAAAPTATGRLRGALFGYGNYAKTNILRNLPAAVAMAVIHEVDPAQIPPGDTSVAWDTRPRPRADEAFDVAFIAGFHHTHAPLAAEALRRGAAAVVEKPAVVDEAQLVELLDAMRSTRGRLFTCFHRRYSPFNELAAVDLGTRPGDPISYHAIVFEVPLPARHWYRWPNSKSRVVSNGSHWLDHFLHLNAWSPVAEAGLAVGPDGTLNASVSLDNGAFLTLVLTDRGSPRLGVQDYVELRAGGVTVEVVNGASYVAKGGDRVLRRRRVNKITTYQRMYKSIFARILDGRLGDTPESLEASSGLILELERLYQSKTRREVPELAAARGAST